MELFLFIGLQASGKSSFYVERFLRSHLHLSLDVLRTRHRESRLFEACLATATRLVIDNTNPTPADRARYLPRARAMGYQVHAYFFDSPLADCLTRNARRALPVRVPPVALHRTASLLVPPSWEEGFDRIFTVHLSDRDGFSVEEWPRRPPGLSPQGR